MPLIAKAPEGTVIFTEGQSFHFDDGTRQISQVEEEALRRYVANGGTVSIDFEEQKPKKGAK
jgi:predicted mannosyl-3-phosphoglycerate phosphatase (HAD superfamily)